MTNRRDLRKELEQDDGTYPPSIILKPGDVLSGTLSRYNGATTKYGDCIIAVIENEVDGKPVSLWITHTVLKNEFARQKPRPGESIAVKYFGEDSARGYHRWKLLVDREEGELPDFEARVVEDEVPNDFALAKGNGSDDEIPF